MIKLFTIIGLFLFSLSIQAQIFGTVNNTEGEVLSYASIYIEGTSVGTSTNIDGYYELSLPEGIHQIIFQYVGYKKEIITLEILSDNQKEEQNITLRNDAESLSEIIITADKEDPAYQIIRNAIAKRKYNGSNINAYSCDVYTKGNQKVLKMPETIFGQEIGDLEGALDSNRQGIIYLSESFSKYHFKAPNQYKEIMISSKVSGKDQGYSFNSAQDMEFDFYQNTIDLNRAIVSPIADNALRYYDYKFLGVNYESAYTINIIEVIPKHKEDPIFSGTIYIIEDLWNIHSVDLTVSSQSSQLYFLKNLNFKQVFIPLEKPDKWRLLSNIINFEFALFGMEIEGLFTSLYSNYDLEPVFTKDFFNNETIKIEKDSNKRDSLYWAEIRPIALSTEEKRDYIKKDSIQEVRNDPIYLDSLDKINNKFKLGSFLYGYDYNNAKKKSHFSISSPLLGIEFNTVQGFNLNLIGEYIKYFDKFETRKWSILPKLSYGFSENKWRASLKTEYRFNRINNATIGMKGGNRLFQFNNDNPISNGWNTAFSLIARRNYAKYYASQYLRLYANGEITNGIFSYFFIETGNNSTLENNSNTSFFYNDDRFFTTNNPSKLYGLNIPLINNPRYTRIKFSFRFRLGQKYSSYPNRKYRHSYEYPSFHLALEKGFKLFGATDNYTHIHFKMDDNIALGSNGLFKYEIALGKFWDAKDIQFGSYQHFNGNETFIAKPKEYLNSFFLLPYYSHSTNDQYLQLHTSYSLEGLLMDKIPIANQWGLKTVAGYKYLYTPDQPPYQEFHIGVDNIGYKLFRMFRVDFVWSIQNDFKEKDFGIILGIKI